MAEVVELSMALYKLGACPESLRWVKSTGNTRFAQTWEQCPRGSWMMWLVARVAHFPVTVDLMIRLVETHLAEDLARSQPAMNTLLLARRWLRGEVDAHMLRTATASGEASSNHEYGPALEAALYILRYVAQAGEWSFPSTRELNRANDASYFIDYLHRDYYQLDLDYSVAQTIRMVIVPDYIERRILTWWSPRE